MLSVFFKCCVYLLSRFDFFTERHEEILGLHANPRQVKHCCSPCARTKRPLLVVPCGRVCAPQGGPLEETHPALVWKPPAPAQVLPRGRIKSSLPSIHEPKERLLVKNSSSERQKQ